MLRAPSKPLHYASQTPIARLRKRGEFVRMTHQAQKIFTASFVWQYQQRQQTCWQIGFTVSKKIGGAVQRNRAKRRLRAVTDDLLRLNPHFCATAGYDVVLVARPEALTRTYADLRKDVQHCLNHLQCHYVAP